MFFAFVFSDLCLDSENKVSLEAQKAAAEFVEAVFYILSSLNNVPRALTLALEGYLDRRHLWDHFYNLAGTVTASALLHSVIVVYTVMNLVALTGSLQSSI